MNDTSKRQVWWAVIVVGSVAIAITLAVALLTTAQTVAQMRRTQKTNSTVLSIMQDCTTPGRKCYERGKRQTAGAVADINRVVILAAACASGLQTGLTVERRQTEIQNCVIQRLAAKPSS